MKAKKITINVLLLILGFVIGCSAYWLIKMNKPVMKASREIPEIKSFALTTNDDLVSRDAKVIGLGEASHGNKEFQQLKLEILKNLIRDHGVSALCMEMDYAEGVLINDYISGASDMTYEELLTHISFQLYHTKEIRELIEWMREYNIASHDGALEFYGFDLQNPEVDLYVIDEYVKKQNIPLQSEAIEAYLAEDFSFSDDRSSELFGDLEKYKSELSDEKYRDSEGISRILKCIDNVYRARELEKLLSGNNGEYATFRDKAMADNVMEISDAAEHPIMIAGHNGHVGYDGSYVKTMGSYLKESLDDQYYVIGTDYFKTKASIKSENGRKNHTSCSADPFAYQAKYLGTYALRFDDVKNNETVNAMITKTVPTGSLGESFSFINKIMPNSVRVYKPVSEMYDAMVFVYQATPFTMI